MCSKGDGLMCMQKESLQELDDTSNRDEHLSKALGMLAAQQHAQSANGLTNTASLTQSHYDSRWKHKALL